MPIGNNPQSSELNLMAGQLAVQLRSVCQSIANLQGYVTGLGPTGLQGAGFSSADATSYQNAVSVLNTIAQIFYGNATQATPFNFSNAILQLTGPQ